MYNDMSLRKITQFDMLQNMILYNRLYIIRTTDCNMRVTFTHNDNKQL
jgi:hypothetical protein